MLKLSKCYVKLPVVETHIAKSNSNRRIYAFNLNLICITYYFHKINCLALLERTLMYKLLIPTLLPHQLKNGPQNEIISLMFQLNVVQNCRLNKTHNHELNLKYV